MKFFEMIYHAINGVIGLSALVLILLIWIAINALISLIGSSFFGSWWGWFITLNIVFIFYGIGELASKRNKD